MSDWGGFAWGEDAAADGDGGGGAAAVEAGGAGGSAVAGGSDGVREQAARPSRKRMRRIGGGPYSTPVMRDLLPTPDSVVDPASRSPRIGSFRGGLPRVDWSPLQRGAAGTAVSLLRHKRWVYAAVATESVYIAVAVVRLGYASNAFLYVYDANERRMLARRSWVGGPTAARVGDTAGAGCEATFRAQGAFIAVERPRGSTEYAVLAEAPGLSLHACLDAADAPPAIGAVAEVAPGRFNATEKRALLAARGSLRVDDEEISLDGGLGGYDFTSGLLARRTRWHWGFALGRLVGGEPFGLNLVQGFVGEAECAAWVGKELFGLGEGRFAFDRARPEAPWRVRTADDAVDLTMTPGAAHEEHRELLVVRSRFVHPCGAWTGTLTLPGREPLRVEHALGATEDQDMTW